MMRCKVSFEISIIILLLISSFSLFTDINDGNVTFEKFNEDRTRLLKPANSSCSMYRGDQQRTGRCNGEVSNNPGTLKWSFQPSTSEIYSSPVIGPDEVIYFGSFDANFYAVYPNGTMKWRYKTGDRIEGTGAIGDDGIVYFGSMDNRLHAVYTSNGTQKWKKYAGPIKGGPVLSDDGMIICEGNGLRSFYPNGTLKWMIDTGSYISSPALGFDGTIYIGSYDDLFYAINPNGTVKWTYPVGDYISSTPAIDDFGNVYFSCWDDWFYALYPNGTLRWKKNLRGQGHFYSSPGIDNSNNIIIHGPDMKIHKFDINGSQVWEEIAYWSRNGPTIDEEDNIIIPSDNDIICLNKDKTIKFYYQLSEGLRSSPAIGSNGEVYFTDLSGTLFCIGGRTSTPPLLRLISSGNGYVNINWIINDEENAPNIDEYRIFRKESNEDEFSLLTVIIDENDIDFNDTNVVNGIEYEYKVTAVNKFGESDPSNVLSIIPMTTPTAPTNVQTLEGDKFIEISWYSPVNNGGSKISSYQIWRKKSNLNDYSLLTELTSEFFIYNDTNVENGVSYNYYIIALNSVGGSPPSEVVSATPQTIPGTPFLHVNTGDGFVFLNWNPPESNGGSEIVTWRIYKGLKNEEIVFLTSIDASESNFNDTAVTNGVSYQYQISCHNSVGESDRSDVKEAIPMGVPTEPINLKAKSGNEFVHLTWDMPDNDHGSEILEYIIHVSSDDVRIPGNYFYTIDGVMNTDFNDTEVVNGFEYTYHVVAWNSIGESASSNTVISYPSTVPMMPASLLQNFGDGFVFLQWNEIIYDGGSQLLGYRIYRYDEIATAYYPLVVLDPHTFTYNDTAVINGVVYWYYVMAFNIRGFSDPTEIVFSKPSEPQTIPEPPLNLTIDIGDDFIILKWDPPSSDGGSEIIQYLIYRGVSDYSFQKIGNVVHNEVLVFNDTNISKGKTYHYFVTALNSKGESVSSNIEHVEVEGDSDDETIYGIWIFILMFIILIIGAIIFGVYYKLLRMQYPEQRNPIDPDSQIEENEDNQFQNS